MREENVFACSILEEVIKEYETQGKYKQWVDDAKKKVADLKAGIENPRVCDILGVEVGEWFRIEEFGQCLFRVLSSGQFETRPANANRSSFVFLDAINGKRKVKKIVEVTPDEMAVLRMAYRAIGEPEKCYVNTADELPGQWVYVMDSEAKRDADGYIGIDEDAVYIPVANGLLPSLKNRAQYEYEDIVCI